MFLHHTFKTIVDEEVKYKKRGCNVASAVKQWSFKAFGSFKEINCMTKYLFILYLLEPNKRRSNKISSFKVLKETSTLNKPIRSFCLFPANYGKICLF